MRQLRFAWAMLGGRPLPAPALRALAGDLRLTMEAFGSAGDDADGLLTPPDPELRADLARRRLRRTVRDAAERTPYYRRWFQTFGVDPGAITPDTIGLLAPTPKALLRDRPAMFVADRAKPAIAATTSGTTGPPTVVWFSQREVELAAASSAFGLMLADGLRPDDVWLDCQSSRSIARLVLSLAVPLTGAAFLPLGIVEPRDAVERLTAPLHLPGKAARPTHLNATPSYLAALVHEAQRCGYRPADFGLRRIHAGGEVLTDALAARAEEVFGARVFDGYSMTEILPVAGQACRHGHLHLPPDQGLVEVLDPVTQRPAAPGSVGTLTVTPYAMYRDTTTLLRYRTDDLVRVLPEGGPVECELAGVPATSRILGRTLAGVDLTTRDVLEVLQAEPALPLPTRFAVTEDARGATLTVVAPGATRALTARLEQRIAAAGLPVGALDLVDDRADLPRPCHLRADLREPTFDRPAVPVAA